MIVLSCKEISVMKDRARQDRVLAVGSRRRIGPPSSTVTYKAKKKRSIRILRLYREFKDL